MTEYPPPPPGNYPPPPPGNYPPPPPPGQGGYGAPMGGYPQQGGYPTPTGTNGLAIASLICSVLGLLCGIGSIVGIVLGVVALNQIKQTGQAGKGMAQAGVIVGAVLLVVGIIVGISVMS